MFKHIIIRLLCAQILGHLKIINFTFGTNGKFIAFKGRFLEFRRYHNFDKLVSKTSESTFYRRIIKFQ